MGKRGPQCSICSDEELRVAINRDLSRGLTRLSVAKKHGLNKDTVGRHDRICNAKPKAKVAEVTSAAPVMPAIEGLNDKQKAEVLVTYLHAQLQWLDRNHADDVKSRTLLMAQLHSAQKTLARINGAFDITQVQIVRSQAWAQLMAYIRTVLAAHPDALVTLVAGLEELDKQGKL